MKKYLMIEMQDKRRFLTHEKNYPHLLEFANMFNAEISIVKAKVAEVLDLIPLADAISSKNYNCKHEVELIEVRKPKKYRRRKP